MKILLDFDGVMVTTPMWRAVAQLDDGFMAFNECCVNNLAEVFTLTQADIVLTTTHRIHYDNATWKLLLQHRGLITQQVNKVNTAQYHHELANRCVEVEQWVQAHPHEAYLIIDDDKSLNALPEHIKQRWVETQFNRGFDEQAKRRALHIVADDDTQ